MALYICFVHAVKRANNALKMALRFLTLRPSPSGLVCAVRRSFFRAVAAEPDGIPGRPDIKKPGYTAGDRYGRISGYNPAATGPGAIYSPGSNTAGLYAVLIRTGGGIPGKRDRQKTGLVMAPRQDPGIKQPAPGISFYTPEIRSLFFTAPTHGRIRGLDMWS